MANALPAPVPAPSLLRQIDWGRLAMVPVATVLLLFNVMHFWASVTGSEATVASIARTLCLILFYAFVLEAYFRRRKAKATSASGASHVAAVVASWLPLALPIAGGATPGAALSVAGSALLVLGLAWSVWSLRTLSLSFSVLAQARAVVSSGPYRVVRHPLYFGELLATFGIVLTAPSVAIVALWLALVGLQLFRIHHEEAVLSAALPEYTGYRVGTRRVIPWVY